MSTFQNVTVSYFIVKVLKKKDENFKLKFKSRI